MDESTLKTEILKIKAEIQQLFPGINFEDYCIGEVVDNLEKWNRIHLNISPNNANLFNSSFYYTKKSIVHFTNLDSIWGILNGQSFRLYNLHNLNDPREFTFASDLLKLEPSKIADSKDNIFVSSFCKRDIFSAKRYHDQFNMWRLYGDSGKGVAIVFSIKNNPLKWDNFHISEVKYGAVYRDPIFQLIRKIENLSSSTIQVDFDLGKLCAFIKSKLFSLEQEVRIVFDKREKRLGGTIKVHSINGKVVSPIIKPGKKKNEKIKFLELPIYNKNNQLFEEHSPLLKIDQIIIGYDYLAGTESLISDIVNQCNNNLGYQPTVKQTNLKRIFWG